MIAEVYPLKRMPRSMNVFDYRIPEDLSPTRGSFVRITIRNKPYWGIVRQVKDKPPRGIKLKPLLEVSDRITLRDEELTFYEDLAKDLIQSVSSVLHACLPTPPKNKRGKKEPPLSWLPLTLPSSETNHVIRLVRDLSKRGRAFVQTPDLRRSLALILGFLQVHPEQKIVIIAPTVRDVELLRKRFTGYQPLLLTGSETNNERWRTWERFRSMPSGVLIGTRMALMMVDASVTSIFFLRAGVQTHKQTDRNPRYDGRDIVWDLHERFHLNVFLLDACPRAADLARFHPTEFLSWGAHPEALLVNQHQEQLHHPSAIVSYSTQAQIEQQLQTGQRVLVVFNRKGGYKHLLCGDCSHHFSCPNCSTTLTTHQHAFKCSYCRHVEPLPSKCPACQSTNLLRLGHGNVQVAQELSRLFPNTSVKIVEKGVDDLDADILVVTQHYYENLRTPFTGPAFSLVVHLDSDTPLFSSSPLAVEHFTHDVWQWAWFAYAHRALYVAQTHSIDLLEQVLREPVQLMQNELRSRETYSLPPLFRWARITLREPEQRRAEIALNHLREQLMTIPEALVHAPEWREDGFGQFDVGIPRAQWPLLHHVFASLSDNYIIDTNVFC
jgi:primosomal protein N'